MSKFAHAALSKALAAKPAPDAAAAFIGQYGDAEVEFYAPRGTDDQQPHTRDELYIIARGSGIFAVEDRQVRFVPGDVLFVAAGVEHRFAEFSDDFGTWVIFYGPEVV
jgi:mannose-6-phosphate isomerase-like protein (cupin superfamily)